MSLNDSEKNKILFLLKNAQSLSYSPYSNFKVGAVLFFNDGTYTLGANIENASYSLTMCAERNAIFQAILQKKDLKQVKYLAIIGKTNSFEDVISPCGACRQVMVEFLSLKTKVYLFNDEGNYLETNVEKLLPYSFRKESLI